MHAFVVAELNLQQVFQKYNKKFQPKNKFFFNIRIGLTLKN